MVGVGGELDGCVAFISSQRSFLWILTDEGRTCPAPHQAGQPDKEKRAHSPAFYPLCLSYDTYLSSQESPVLPSR